jgi:hypothetical protein
VLARIVARDADEALRLYLDGWMTDFNMAAIGSHVGTAPLDAAQAVPPNQPNTLTVSEYVVKSLDSGPSKRLGFQVTFLFWLGNPLSSAQPAEPFESSSTYDLSWDSHAEDWIITLTSSSPEDGLHPISYRRAQDFIPAPSP